MQPNADMNSLPGSNGGPERLFAAQGLFLPASGQGWLLIGLLTLSVLIPARANTSAYVNSTSEVFRTPREAALAGANIVYARDASLLCNPANVSIDRERKLMASYAGYFGNAFSTTVASIKGPIAENAGFGFSVNYAHAPDVMITTNLETYPDAQGVDHPVYDSTRLANGMVSETQFAVQYGRRFSLRGVTLAAGAEVHGMRRRLLDEAGIGIGLDLGATALFPRPGIRIALTADDITTNYVYWHDGYTERGAPHVRLGAGWSREFPYVYGKIAVVARSADLLGNEGVRVTINELNDSLVTEGARSLLEEPGAALKGALGIEYIIRDIVSFRAGINPDGYAFGGGVALFSQALSFDFAYAGSDLAGSYFASIAYSW